MAGFEVVHAFWPGMKGALERLLRIQKNEERKPKSQLNAFLWAFFFGGLGAHHFYTGNDRLAWRYLLFYWTLVPFVLGFRDAVKIALADPDEFERIISIRTPSGLPG